MEARAQGGDLEEELGENTMLNEWRGELEERDVELVRWRENEEEREVEPRV